MVEDVPLTTSSSRHAPQYDPVKAGVSHEAVQAYMSGIQRMVNCLSDPDRSKRRQAASGLQGRLTGQDSAAEPGPEPSLLQALMCGPLLHPVVALLHDQTEACRSAGAAMLTHAAQRVGDFGPALPVLVPELVRRMGQLPVVEPSEEVRLQLAELVSTLVSRVEAQVLASYSSELSTFLCRAFEDGYHDIKKAACTCLCALSAKVRAEALEPHAEKLLQALLPNLQHQHSRVRLAAIEALDALIGSGAVAAGLVESLVAPGVKAVANDRAANVREALNAGISHWLGYRAPGTSGSEQSPAGAASQPGPGSVRLYAPVLLPLLLLGVSDPQASVAATALQLVEGVGQAWQQQQQGHDASGSSSSQATGAADGQTSMDTEGTDAQAALEPSSSSSSEGYSAVAAQVVATRLGAPYTGRVSAGARRMVRDLLPSLLPPLVKELGEWTVGQRVSAARQLQTVLVLAEAEATTHLAVLVPGLCSGIGDSDAEVAQRVIGAVHTLGAHVAPTRWLPLTLDHLANSKLSLVQKANTLVVLSGLLHAAATVQQAQAQQQAQVLPSELLQLLAKALISDDVRASEHPAVRQQLLGVAVNTIKCVGSRCVEVAPQLYTLLLQLYGYERDTSRMAAIAEAMQQLAVQCGHSSFEALAAQHAEALMQSVCADTSGWSAEAPAYLVFRALLLSSGVSTLCSLVPAVAAALGPILADHDRDATLRLNALQLLDTLLEDASRREALGGPRADVTLTQLLLPPLVWRAGKTAAAVRFAAITALDTMLVHKMAPAATLMRLVGDGTLLPLLVQSLDEDWYVDVRNTGCHVVELLLLEVGAALTHEHRRALYPELTKRLDDSSNQVRIAACAALVAFCTTMAPSYCDTNTAYLAAAVIIHMDDSEVAIQEAACRVMEALGAVKPAVVAAEVNKVRERFRAKHYCDRVLAVCSQAQ